MNHHRLRLGDLILSDGQDPHPNDGTFTFAVHGSSLDAGQPVPVEVEIRTALRDGGRVSTESHGLREFTFAVEVGGPDSVSLGQAEEALARWIGVRTELGMTPPDGWAPETVFEVETSSFQWVPDDLAEVLRGERVYLLRFVCQPFVRAAELVTVPAVPIPSGVTPETLTIDAGTATTYWSARIGTLADAGSYLTVGGGTKTPRVSWTGAAPFDTSGHHYISLDHEFTGSTVGPMYLLVDGVYAELVARTVGDSLAQRLTWLIESDSVSTLEVGVDFLLSGQTLRFNNLTASNVPPYFGTTKQTARAIDVKGSARTQGSLMVAAPDEESLGSALVYTTTSATGGNPSLRKYRTSGDTPFADTAAITGLREIFTAGVVFDIPVAELATGKHQLVTSLYSTSLSSGTFTVSWTAQVRVGSTNVGPIESGSTTFDFEPTSYGIRVLDNVTLPPSKVPATSTAVVRITITCADSLLRFDEGWVFNLDHGALSWCEVGDYQRVWFETPTTERPEPAVFIGDAEDQSDAFDASMLLGSWGEADHEFKGVTSAFIITTGTDAASSSFTYYPRYYNFVPRDES